MRYLVTAKYKDGTEVSIKYFIWAEEAINFAQQMVAEDMMDMRDDRDIIVQEMPDVPDNKGGE